MNNHRYNIGDFVRCGGQTVKLTKCNRFPDADESIFVKTCAPFTGWIVGMVRRFVGEKRRGCEEESPYLAIKESKVFYKVVQSMTNTPLEVAPEQITIRHYNITPVHDIPYRLGQKWVDPTGSVRKVVSDLSKTWPRDAKGKWIKKAK